MSRYLAFTTAGTFDIGEFASVNEAWAWAQQRYGSDLQAVDEQPTASVTVTTTPPVPVWVWAGAAVALFLLFQGKGRTHDKTLPV